LTTLKGSQFFNQAIPITFNGPAKYTSRMLSQPAPYGRCKKMRLTSTHTLWIANKSRILLRHLNSK